MAAFEGRAIPKTAELKAKYLRLEMPSVERLYAGLRALAPPHRETGTYRHLLRMAQREIRDAHVSLRAFETGQARRAALVERGERRDHLNRRANSLSRKRGLNLSAQRSSSSCAVGVVALTSARRGHRPLA
jgi:hypothetical protein